MRHQKAQGDLLFIPVSKKTARGEAVKPEQGRLILARGEATGHQHSVAVAEGRELREYQGTTMYLTLDQITEVEHQEHATVTLEPGAWEVRRQREWTDDEEPIRVAD